MPMTQITDHEDQAQARLPEQFKGKDRVIAMVRALASETQDIEDAGFPMFDLLNISTQIGAQLDGIGDILTEPRNGASDVDYRVVLLAKAARITASGTPEQVIERFLGLTGVLSGVDYTEAFPAGYCIGATVPTKSDVQSGAPAGQVITLVTGGLGTADAFAGGAAINATTKWAEKAPQLGAETQIRSLVVFNGKLYGGTQSGGRLYEWDDVDEWVQVAPQLNSQTSISSLAVFDGKLYGGTVSSNGGRLFEWNGTNAWVQVAPRLNTQNQILSLVVFNGKLYGGTGTSGRLFEWNGTNAWVEVAPQLNSQIQILSLVVFDGKLYGGTSSTSRLFEWDGASAWVEVAPQLGSETDINALVVFNGKIYGGTLGTGRLFEWNGTNAWVEVAPQLGAETNIRSLVVFSGKIYGGTGNASGKLYAWNGTDAWDEKAPQRNGQINIFSLVVFDSKLYGGTGSGGRLLEWDGLFSVRAIASHTDNTATLTGALAEWVDTDVLFFYGSPVVGDILDAMIGASPTGVFVGLIDLFALEDDDLFLLEDGDTMYVTYESTGR